MLVMRNKLADRAPVAVDIVRRLVRTLGEANIASVLDIGAAAWEIPCELPCSHGEPRIITNFPSMNVVADFSHVFHAR